MAFRIFVNSEICSRSWFRAVTMVGVTALTLTGCTTPDTISKFCGSAATTMSSSQPVFSDMKQSCLREVNSRQDFATFKPPTENDPDCDEIGKKAAGAVAAAKILGDYFTAINSLASFGTTKVGSDAKDLASKTGAALGEKSPAQTAIGAIAQFLVTAATSGYQRRSLEKDLTQASGNVTNVINGLVEIIQKNYIGQLLTDEQTKLAVRYEDFAKTQHADAEVKLMLDDRWNADEQALLAKRASAQSLIAALQSVSTGFSELAANSRKLEAKELPGLLEPYVQQIQSLIPQIQKAF